MRREDAVVQDQVDARPWRDPSTSLGVTLSLPKGERGQPFEEFERVEDQLRRAVGPPMAQLEHDLPVARQVQPVLRDGRSQRVPAHAFEPLPVSRGHDEVGVQIEPVQASVPGTSRGRRDHRVRITPATQAGPGARTHRTGPHY
jgi:hypothetical protein